MQFAEIINSFSIRTQPHSEIEIAGEVPAEAVAKYRDEALSHIAEHLNLPGFRKGKVPKDMALQKAGEMGVLEEAVEMFMRDFYPEFILTKKIDAVGRPDIRITKLAPGNPVAVTIRTAVYPIVDVPSNWKKLAANIPAAEAKEATDEEVAQTLHSLRESRINADKNTSQMNADTLRQSASDLRTSALEINDEFARSLGAFKDVEDLKAQVRKGISEEKLRAARDARRAKIIEALLEKVKTEMPRIFVESELDKILLQMKEDISRMGMSWDDYLKRTNKKEEDIRTEFRAQAEKRAKLQLLLNKLAADEKVEADKADIEAEMKHALEHFPEADPERVSVHIETVLRNEKVLKLLEAQQ